MPRTVTIPFDGNKPWLSVYFIVSCIAYPQSIKNTKQKRFFDALRFRREARRIPKHLRDMFIKEELKEIIDNGWKSFDRTISAGLILALQVMRIEPGGPATVANLEKYARMLIGWDPDNVNTTYKSKIWKPSWPVIHLAVTINLYLYDQPNRRKWLLGRTLGSYPALVELLKIQDELWVTIPHFDKKFKDQLIKFKFAPAQEQIVDEKSRKWHALFAGLNLMYESEPGDCFRAVKDETGTLQIELVPREVRPVAKTSS